VSRAPASGLRKEGDCKQVQTREYALGTFGTAQGKTARPLLTWPDYPEVKTFDLILRASARAARQTVELFDIWDGELLYPNIKVPWARSRFRRR